MYWPLDGCTHAPCRAPECFNRPVKLSGKTDVWALGCVICAMLSEHGHVELHEADMQALREHRAPAHGPKVPHGLPDGVAALLKACFRIDPRKRPTAMQVVEVRATPGSPGSPARIVYDLAHPLVCQCT